jgi:hypothetical protein
VPTNPEVIYVPVYDPMYIWGPPVWGYYPALWYPSYGFGFWPGINIGLCFGGWGGWGGWGAWGWSPVWFNRTVFVNFGFFNHFGFHGGFGGGFGSGVNGRFAWTHDPMHRLGVAYPNRQLTSRFGAASAASRANFGRANFGSYGMRNSFGQSSGGGRTRDSFGQSWGASRGRDSFGQSYANRGANGAQSFRGMQPGLSRGGGYQGSPYQSGPRSFSAPSYRGPAAPGGGFRGYSGGAPTFRGGYSAPSSRSFNSAPAFRGGGSGGGFRGPAPSFQGGGRSFGSGAPRNFGGGGGGHSFGGGGGHSGGGGGGHSGGGGGHHR